MNNYRQCSVHVVVENRTRLHNVTCYVGKNSIRLFGTTCGLTPYKDFNNMRELKECVLRLCKNNHLKPRILAKDFDTVMYDINYIDITRPFEITRLVR